MTKYKNIFSRFEQKYIIDTGQFNYIKTLFAAHMTADEYGESTIHSLYYDTPDFALIRDSVDKKPYREKIRLRSYGTPGENSIVFAELKKKYRGITYKRRIDIPYYLAPELMSGNSKSDDQIARELTYAINSRTDLQPRVFLSYDRQAFFAKDKQDFRITFDRNILWRTDNLKLDSEVYGNLQLPGGKYIMELKTPDTIPLWMARLLDDICAYPASHSKYATAYKGILNQQEKGGTYCA